MTTLKDQRAALREASANVFNEGNRRKIIELATTVENSFLLAEFERCLKLEVSQLFREIKEQRQGVCTEHSFSEWKLQTRKYIHGYADYYLRTCSTCGFTERLKRSEYPHIETEIESRAEN